MYQSVDAFITEQLQQPHPVLNWTTWPTLYSFCESLFSIGTRRGYRFYLGKKRYGYKDQATTAAPSLEYCFPGPSVSTLDLKKSPPIYNSGPHLNNLMLLLTMLNTLDGIPTYQGNGIKKYFTCVHYDGMPLNIGTFPRQENGEIIFDGILPAINLHQMEDLYRNGNAAVHSYIKENCEWISEVKEYDMMDASGNVNVNVFTSFGASAGNSDSVKDELKEALQCLQSCTNCILSDNATTCTFSSLDKPCERCDQKKCTNESPCVSAKILHISSDQAPSQRKAHMELNKDAPRDLLDPDYIQYGFGLLHFAKNCISSLRHYRLTDMSGTFYIGLMTAVWASNSNEATMMKKAAPATVFSFRDAHSDETGYKSVCKEMEEVMKQTKAVVATLVPEQYKPTAREAKTHEIIGRPLYITCNGNGDFLWTGKSREYY